MRTILAALSLAALACTVQADNWAVVIVGSMGFGNYRHQADGMHAYHVLSEHGIPPSNIITMSYDDVATSAENPYPGELYNRPCTGNGDCRDVRANATVDYSGQQVTAANMLKVLSGESIDGGKKLGSGANDNVFVVYVDHGGPGILGTPQPPYLYAKDLLATLQQMHDSNMYKQLTFYIEACESGSIFQALPDNINIYATTAADATESSWGCYCPPEDVVKGKSINSCLGDLYMVSWMENSETGTNMKTETLQQQYEEVKTLVNRSHVTQFGDQSIASEKIGAFLSNAGVSSRPVPAMRAADSAIQGSRDAGLASLYARFENAPSALAKDAAQRAIQEEMTARVLHGAAAEAVVELLPDVEGLREAESADIGRMTDDVFDWDCYKALNHEIEAACGGRAMTDFTFKYTRVNALACRADGRGAKGGVAAATAAIRSGCAFAASTNVVA